MSQLIILLNGILNKRLLLFVGIYSKQVFFTNILAKPAGVIFNSIKRLAFCTRSFAFLITALQSVCVSDVWKPTCGIWSQLKADGLSFPCILGIHTNREARYRS